MKIRALGDLIQTRKFIPNSGFFLIEISLGLILIGLFLSTMYPVFRNMYLAQKKVVDERRQEQILIAIADFVKLHNRLPRPAMIPERRSGSNGSSNGSSSGSSSGSSNGSLSGDLSQREAENQGEESSVAGLRNPGIVPYKTLMLPEHVARNSHGRFFIYAIEPELAEIEDDALSRSKKYQVLPARYRRSYKVGKEKQGETYSFCSVRPWEFTFRPQNMKNERTNDIHREEQGENQKEGSKIAPKERNGDKQSEKNRASKIFIPKDFIAVVLISESENQTYQTVLKKDNSVKGKPCFFIDTSCNNKGISVLYVARDHLMSFYGQSPCVEISL